MSATAYPLQWPAGRPRTKNRERSNFKVPSLGVVRDEVFNELKLLKAQHAVLSTNLALRNDGIPYASQRQPDDPGVAVYFTDRHGRQVAFSCDRWTKIEDNLRAIQKTIEAIRGIARWGTGDAVDAAFTGFAALPPSPMSKPWWEVLCAGQHASDQQVHEAYRRMCMENHPDRGGSNEAMALVNRAYEQFKKERGLS